MWTSETEQILSALAGIGYGTDFEVFEGPDGITASVALVWRPRREAGSSDRTASEVVDNLHHGSAPMDRDVVHCEIIVGGLVALDSQGLRTPRTSSSVETRKTVRTAGRLCTEARGVAVSNFRKAGSFVFIAYVTGPFRLESRTNSKTTCSRTSRRKIWIRVLQSGSSLRRNSMTGEKRRRWKSSKLVKRRFRVPLQSRK